MEEKGCSPKPKHIYSWDVRDAGVPDKRMQSQTIMALSSVRRFIIVRPQCTHSRLLAQARGGCGPQGHLQGGTEGPRDQHLPGT